MSGIPCEHTPFVPESPTVHIVDDDPDTCGTTARLIRTIGFAVSEHDGGAEFLSQYHPDTPGCVVLDVAMPGMSGLQVQELLNAFDLPPPVIFVSGHAHVPHAVQALRAGAIDFLVKPI